MAERLDPGEKLIAGVVLIVVGLVGLNYRLTGFDMVIGNIRSGHMVYGGSYTIISIIVIIIFLIVTILGIYIVYDTIKKDTRN